MNHECFNQNRAYDPVKLVGGFKHMFNQMTGMVISKDYTKPPARLSCLRWLIIGWFLVACPPSWPKVFCNP